MKAIIHNLKKFNTSKTQLTIVIKFISSKDTDEKGVMHSKSDNIEIMIYTKADEVIEERFVSLLNRYQIWLETSMKSSDFIFHCVNLLHYKFHKINLNRGRPYINFPDLRKNNNNNNNKKTTINPINDDDNCFQYAATVTLNHELPIRKR